MPVLLDGTARDEALRRLRLVGGRSSVTQTFSPSFGLDRFAEVQPDGDMLRPSTNYCPVITAFPHGSPASGPLLVCQEVRL